MAERSPAPRLLMLLPCAPDAPHGNATTALRLAEGLRRRHWQVELREAPSASEEPVPVGEAELVLALHAGKAAPQGLRAARAAGLPLVVLFTGTDLNGRPSAAAHEAVAGADASVALGVAAGRRARTLFEGLGDSLAVIRQAVLPLPRGGPLPDGVAAPTADEERVVVAAGIRPVKDPLRALLALEPLAARRPGLRLLYAGPELDASCGAELREALATRPWAQWIGAVSREQMAPLLRGARVVLSTSRSEGGPPNTLLEAVQAGVSVLASDIPPHREFPGDPHLFRDDTGLRTRLIALLDDPLHGAMELRRLQEIVRDRHSTLGEAEAWDRLLRRVRSGAPPLAD